MNYLAHLFLAGEDEGLLIGNFIADSVRGKELQTFPENIRKGIILHRKIDSFTDAHPLVRKTTQKLRNSSGKYAPVVADIVYDHFLAARWNDYSLIPLSRFAESKYHFLHQNIQLMPSKMHELLSYMTKQNWLVNYASLHGIARTLSDMSKRVHFANTMATSIEDLKSEYDSFYNDFREFFPEIQHFVSQEKASL